uniref:Uncharacterized protein n=1 Tax=Brassica campestris TaxID=3711 RepID=M4DC13_BRACM
MMTTLINEIRGQRTTNQTLANRLDQAEKELAEYRAANARERNQAPLDPLRATSNIQSTRLFGTPEIPSARSGRYTGENSERVNKNNASKKPPTSKEPTTKGQHSYPINNSPQKSSTYDLSKYCAFPDRKGQSTEECRAALRNQNKNKKTNEEAGEEEEPVTPKSNRKTKGPTNKRGRGIEQESPSSPPPAPKKRVGMILWGQNSKATDEIKSQTEGKICFEITVAIRTLEKTDEDNTPPQVMKYN